MRAGVALAGFGGGVRGAAEVRPVPFGAAEYPPLAGATHFVLRRDGWVLSLIVTHPLRHQCQGRWR